MTARGEKKEKANLVRPLEKKKSRDTQSVGQKKSKNLPRILQCYNYKSGDSYKINLNRESKILSFTLSDHQEA